MNQIGGRGREAGEAGVVGYKYLPRYLPDSIIDGMGSDQIRSGGKKKVFDSLVCVHLVGFDYGVLRASERAGFEGGDVRIGSFWELGGFFQGLVDGWMASGSRVVIFIFVSILRLKKASQPAKSTTFPFLRFPHPHFPISPFPPSPFPSPPRLAPPRIGSSSITGKCSPPR